MKSTQKANNLIFFTFMILLSVCVFFIKDSSSYVYIFTSLSIITYVMQIIPGNRKEPLSKECKYFLFSILALVIYISIQKYFNGYSSSRLRIYFLSLLFLTLINIGNIRKISARVIPYIFLASAFTSLISTFYLNVYLNIEKQYWHITASTISTITVIIASLSLYHLSFEKNKNKNNIIFLSTFLLCILSSLLLETRTSWLSLIIISCIVGYKKKRLIIEKFRKNKMLSSVIIITIITFTLFMVDNKIQETLFQINRAIYEDGLGSIGLRLTMWKSYFIITDGNYLFGLGDSFKATMFENAKLGKINSIFLQWHPNHLHNEYFDRLAKQGIVGFSVFLGFISYSVYLCSKNDASKPAIFMIIAISVNGLTDTSFELMQVIPLYLTLIYFYLSRASRDNL